MEHRGTSKGSKTNHICIDTRREDQTLKPTHWPIVSSDPGYKLSMEDQKLEFSVADFNEFWTDTYWRKNARDISTSESLRLAWFAMMPYQAIEKQRAQILKLAPSGHRGAERQRIA